MKTYKMEINGEKFEGRVIEYDGLNAKVEINGIAYKVKMEPEFGKNKKDLERSKKVITLQPSLSGKSVDSLLSPGNVKAPLPGVIIDLKVKEGDEVKEGDLLIILEAMKMESELTASVKGTVKKINVKVGESVLEDQLLVEIEESKDE
ncbi:MAG: biotin/lipoyl-binding protein [Candidatus Cloacimonetes bacterium]|nr:biotin/lipoyl-binding protein [Candidatus Cloacimonadota bacterium]